MEQEIKAISLDKITFIADPLRTHKLTDDHIIDLAEDIKQRGLLDIPTVVPAEEEGFFNVTNGARRVTALKLLFSKNEIPEFQNFNVKDRQSEIDTLADQIAGNVKVLKTANKKYIAALYKLATEGGLTADELAKKAGMGKEYMFKLFKTLKLSDEVMKEAEAGKVTISNLISLSDLVGKVDEDGLLEWVERAKTEKAADFAVAVVEEIDILKKAARGEPREDVFKPVKKLLKREELEILLTQTENAFNDAPNKTNETRYQLMKEIWQIDEKSIDEQKAKWEQDKADKEEKKAKRKEAREKAKLEDSIKDLEEAGYSVKPAKAGKTK